MFVSVKRGDEYIIINVEHIVYIRTYEDKIIVCTTAQTFTFSEMDWALRRVKEFFEGE
ncbi:MAG: hypothetical protein ACFFG0_02700 [Candidatus Thorarchaeota archaeon]